MLISTILTPSTLGYIDPATGSIIIGAVAAGGAGVAAAAASGKARLRSVFGRGKPAGVEPDAESEHDTFEDHTVENDHFEDDSEDGDTDATERESAESR